MNTRILVLGGIRSGKSAYAETLVAGPVSYLATGRTDGSDPEWDERLAAHRDRRPPEWTTVECGEDPAALPATLAAAEGPVILDDLGGWISALLDAGDAWTAGPRVADEAITDLAAAVRAFGHRLVVVSPEVGLSVVPPSQAGRVFADALGVANHAIADACDSVAVVVAGQPVWIKGGPPSATGTAGTSADATGVVEITANMDLPLPDEAAAEAAGDRLATLDVPGAGLGVLAEQVRLIAGMQATAHPKPFAQIRALLVSGTHGGGAAAGDPPEHTARRLAEIRAGVGALALLAERNGVAVQIVEAGPEAAPIEETDALPEEAVNEALRQGYALADKAADEGVDLLLLAAQGVGTEAVTAAVVALTTGAEPAGLLDRVVTPDGYVDDNAWMRRATAVREALHRVRARRRDAHALLATIGGADLAVAVGILVGATARRTPILVDGPVGVAAGLIAREIGAQTRHWTLLADHGDHPSVTKAADVLGLRPWTSLKLSLGEGTNALMALPTLQQALTLAHELTQEPKPPAPDIPETPGAPAATATGATPDASTEPAAASATAAPGTGPDSAEPGPASGAAEPGAAPDGAELGAGPGSDGAEPARGSDGAEPGSTAVGPPKVAPDLADTRHETA